MEGCRASLKSKAPRAREASSRSLQGRSKKPQPQRTAHRQACISQAAETSSGAEDTAESQLGRRAVLTASAASLALVLGLDARPARAVQGAIAGRLPGLRGPDAEGWYTYTRPEGKSGGHGTGWTEIPRYSFKVPAGWSEVPVSIADGGGTEIDLRFANSDQGSLQVVVAPIARFLDVDEGTKIKIEEIGSPDRIISGFHPEIYGKPMQDDDLIQSDVIQGTDGLTHYIWELKPHHLVGATAYGNRMFLIALNANGRQWRRSAEALRQIQTSFLVNAA
ncbi:hypothetical protein WJX73_005612 [Symbiochloris irregularis]|uniref:PsbP C-terminal domain-containing protein n=1 Tax=Symbiochloris irregularis TaxID=706552 RepID=A0AAW1PHV9_9CHLO